MTENLKYADFIGKHLKCPVCDSRMVSKECHSYCLGERCHSFDFSGSGYLNLALNQKGTGDSKEAVRARSRFLSSGAYRTIADEIAKIINKAFDNGVVVDAGCGEGYYTNIIAQNKNLSVIGLDLSKYAIDSASKSAKRLNNDNSFFAVANIFDIPLQDACANIVTNIFAPCAAEEFHRILSDDGILILCGAGREHLLELKRIVYDDVYVNGKRNDLPSEKLFRLIDKSDISYRTVVEGNSNISDLFSMTPYYWRTSIKDKEKLDGVERLEVEVNVEILIYKKVL